MGCGCQANRERRELEEKLNCREVSDKIREKLMKGERDEELERLMRKATLCKIIQNKDE